MDNIPTCTKMSLLFHKKINTQKNWEQLVSKNKKKQEDKISMKEKEEKNKKEANFKKSLK